MHADLDDRRSRLLGRLIARLGLAYQRRLGAAGKAAPAISPAHKAVLIHMAVAGNRTNTLAERLGISKQAVSKLIQGLEASGHVKREPDRTDGRASLILFTRRGRALVEDTVAVFEALDREAVEVLGERQAANLRRALERWAAHLDPQGF